MIHETNQLSLTRVELPKTILKIVHNMMTLNVANNDDNV